LVLLSAPFPAGFFGSQIAWVSADQHPVGGNTLARRGNWLVRMLQSLSENGFGRNFLPCQMAAVNAIA
jgi:hypothetical protein